MISAGRACAGEPLFGYVYTTDTLPKGKAEFEQWITDRDGQAHGEYRRLEGRSVAEYGLTDRLQASLYWNYDDVVAQDNSVRRRTEGLGIAPGHDPAQSYSRLQNDGLSAELIYRVFSPYLAPAGLAFKLQADAGPKASGIELRSIVQKNFLDDRLVFAGNAGLNFRRVTAAGPATPGSAPGGQPAAGGRVSATTAEFDLGASYRFRPHWSAGLELREQTDFRGSGVEPDHRKVSAVFLGPDLHFAGERWFATVSALYQLGARADTADQKAQIFHGRIYGDAHTTWDGLRLKVGRTFE